jgi:tetratricopeptide (TPR) repeat protein
MRFEFSRRSRFVSCFVLAVTGVMFASGSSAFAQEDGKAADVATPTDTAAPADAGATGEEGEQPTAQQILEKGQEALKAGDFSAAYTAFDQLAKAGERGVDQQSFQLRLVGFTGRGEALAGMKEYDAAIEEFKEALMLEENFVPALLARGKMYLTIGNPDNYPIALADYQKAIKSQRANMEAQFGLGKALALTGNYQQAIAPLTRVIEAMPDNAEAYRLRGNSYASMFKLQEAVADFNKSLELNPNDYETYFGMAALAFRAENFPQAIEMFGKAIETYKPKDPEDTLPFIQGYLSRAAVYMEMAKKLVSEAEKKAAYESAIQECEEVLLKLDKDNPYHAGIRASALYSRGLAERMLGRLPDAVQTFSEAIELNPELAEAYYRRGICYHYLDDNNLAISDFTEAASINIGDPRASLWEGFTHAKMGNYHDALRAYSNAIAASDRYTPAYLNRGLAYMATREYDKALADFSEAVRLEPKNSDYYFKRGQAFEALANWQKAAESFASAIEFNDKHAAAYRHLADAMQRLDRTDLANQYRARADELEPSKSGR